MNEQFEKELEKLLIKYYGSNWEFVWEFIGDTLETKLWVREEKIEEVKCPKCAEFGMDVLADKVNEEIICTVCQEAEYEQRHGT